MKSFKDDFKAIAEAIKASDTLSMDAKFALVSIFSHGIGDRMKSGLGDVDQYMNWFVAKYFPGHDPRDPYLAPEGPDWTGALLELKG